MEKEFLLTQILESWQTNNRINLFLIDKISDEGMRCSLSKRGGRNVVRQFAHLHNNRVWQLQKRAKELSEGLSVFESKEEPSKKVLIKNLNQSAKQFEIYFSDILDNKSKRKTFNKGIISYLSYFVAHESHHRGSILLTLKECGHKLDSDTSMAIWNWDKI